MRQRDFERFVTSHATLFRRFIAGVARDGGDIDEALQRGLLRMWAQWEHWPSDSETRRRYALAALRFAGKDTIRHARRIARNEQPFDFSSLDDPDADDATVAAVRAAVTQAATTHAEQPTSDAHFALVARRAVRVARRHLTARERRILALRARGLTHRQIADRLGVSHQRARVLFMDAQWLLERLTAHAVGVPLTRDEYAELDALPAGRLTGRLRRRARRHHDACPTCQQVRAQMEDARRLPHSR